MGPICAAPTVKKRVIITFRGDYCRCRRLLQALRSGAFDIVGELGGAEGAALEEIADGIRPYLCLLDLGLRPVILGFAGLDLRGDTLGIDPRLPPQWRSLSFRVCWRGRSVAIRIVGGTVQATLAEGEAMEMRIGADTHKLTAGATLQVSV